MNYHVYAHPQTVINNPHAYVPSSHWEDDFVKVEASSSEEAVKASNPPEGEVYALPSSSVEELRSALNQLEMQGAIGARDHLIDDILERCDFYVVSDTGDIAFVA